MTFFKYPYGSLLIKIELEATQKGVKKKKK